MADVSRLPGPNADFWDWQLRGSCRGTDSDLFFHPEGERGQARSSREESAKEVCLHCPVCKPCQEHALKVHEPYGVWGGMTEEEREEFYMREKAAVRAARVAAVAAAAAAAAAVKPGKPGRKAPAKTPVRKPVRPGAVPANAITMSRPTNTASAGSPSRAKAKSKSSPAG
jgi:WhiB family transcriptional regulator, redox-sensing transcriptional regulator